MTMAATAIIDREAEESLARLEALARLMDGSFVVPGTNFRFGVDAVVGLVPVAGDMISGLISSYLIWEARRLNVPKWVIGRMVANTFLDTTLRAISILTSSWAFRANMKNMALLRRHLTLGVQKIVRSSRAKLCVYAHGALSSSPFRIRSARRRCCVTGCLGQATRPFRSPRSRETQMAIGWTERAGAWPVGSGNVGW
jgi:hypothetical protein